MIDTITINNYMFDSDDNGLFDLRDIYKWFKTRKPSDFLKHRTGKALREAGHITVTPYGNTFRFKSSREATIAFCFWADLNVPELVKVVTIRDETYFGRLLQQIFPDVQFQVEREGYRVDFYVPSLDLYIEYDEEFHKYQKDADLERMKKIGGEFYRVKQGKEVDALVHLRGLTRSPKVL